MKVLTVSTLLLLSSVLNVVNAKDALIEEPKPNQELVQSDRHITWQDFQQRLVSHTRIVANMTGDGAITLRGFVSSPFEGDKLEEMARQVTGATKVLNYTGTR